MRRNFLKKIRLSSKPFSKADFVDFRILPTPAKFQNLSPISDLRILPILAKRKSKT